MIGSLTENEWKARMQFASKKIDVRVPKTKEEMVWRLALFGILGKNMVRLEGMVA